MNDRRALMLPGPGLNQWTEEFGSNPAEFAAPHALAGSVPLDLRRWVDNEQLKIWVLEETDRVVSHGQATMGFPRKNCPSQTRELCALLTFAYASRVFESQEIVSCCVSDPVFESLCRGRDWSAQELSVFRRRNRPLLEAILASVFLRALRCHFNLPNIAEAGGLQDDLRERAVERLNIARHMDRSDF